MYKVFNMGHRFEIYLPADKAAQVVQMSRFFGVDAQVVGRVEATEEESGPTKLTITSEFGTFEYEK
jgi:phosphoribosylformylglycinamidine cyclo-ligase